ncbi:MAG: hypothetical protein ACYTF6_02190 [Planctomycetota bacterium]|jgi:hypothetical protein
MECCFGAPREQLAIAKEQFRFAQSVYRLQASLTRRYGKGAVKAFWDMTVDGARISFGVPPKDDPTWPDRAEVSVIDAKGSARVTLDNGAVVDWQMVCADGLWRLDLGAAESEPWAEQFKVWRKAIEKTLVAIDTPGFGIRDVKAALHKNLKSEACEN